jgi:hypothetical protein
MTNDQTDHMTTGIVRSYRRPARLDTAPPQPLPALLPNATEPDADSHYAYYWITRDPDQRHESNTDVDIPAYRIHKASIFGFGTARRWEEEIIAENTRVMNAVDIVDGLRATQWRREQIMRGHYELRWPYPGYPADNGFTDPLGS